MVCDGGSFGNVGNDRSGGVDRHLVMIAMLVHAHDYYSEDEP